ncbi:sigma factor [Nonomuraea sp. NPDC050643]|uniref:RNA polymerase sigma factor n=1 Tax=Nonomuraea sp. NPDC050643 TaxID=3155660 RepID=UPI0033FCA69B
MTGSFPLHRLALVRLAFLLVGDQETAEDVVQDAFAAVHRRWSRPPTASRCCRACARPWSTGAGWWCGAGRSSGGSAVNARFPSGRRRPRRCWGRPVDRRDPGQGREGGREHRGPRQR